MTVDRRRQRVWIVVHDTGMGIEPAFLAQVFEPFTQADRSLDRSRGGLGLGLAVVKGLIELHGGEVTAQSEGLGRGSIFTLWLPLAELPAEHPKVPDVPIPTGRCRRVLVADDNRDSADSLRLLLEALGHEVAVAYTGPAAVAVAQEFCPDVVVCDIGLPELDGFGVARALRAAAATRTARLIALSGYATDMDRRRSAAAGFETHLIKPVEPAALQDAVEQAGSANHRYRIANEFSDPDQI
jgi:CheY-like chemotaxis protein